MSTDGINQTAVSYTNDESFMTKVEKDSFWDYERFELSLSDLAGEDYFDFIVNENNNGI